MEEFVGGLPSGHPPEQVMKISLRTVCTESTDDGDCLICISIMLLVNICSWVRMV